jgi:hypothetical protein
VEDIREEINDHVEVVLDKEDLVIDGFPMLLLVTQGLVLIDLIEQKKK